MAELTGRNIIGELLSAEGTTVFSAENPATGKTIEGDFHEATGNEIDRAVGQAEIAFESYRKKTGHEKAAFLEAIADEIQALGEILIQRCILETGLPEGRLTGERTRTINQLKLFADLLREGSWVNARIDHALPERQPLPRPDVRSMLRPLGPVVVFGASNFPLAFSVAGGDTTSALSAGCPVIFKAHPSHPGTSEYVGLAIQRAAKKTGMPDGTFSLVHGQTHDTGLRLVRHHAVCAIGFTGSYRGGKAIFDEANKRETPIPVYAEMGSSNPVFILPNALRMNSEQMARDLAASVTLGTGQFCTNPGLIFLEQSEEAAAFYQKLGDAISMSQPGVMLNRSILTNYNEGLSRLRSVTSGKPKPPESDLSNCNAQPALIEASGALFLRESSLQEEVFGPSTLGVTASSAEELFSIARGLHGHLTATILGTEEDLEEYAPLAGILERKVGRVLFNGYPTGVEVCHAMVHGGPFPATTDSRSTSVGTLAITRFARQVCYQNFPQMLLPGELRDDNPNRLMRLIDGVFTRE